MTYYDTFINAMRSTGDSNSTRWLVVQGPNTDIDLTDSLVDTLPKHPTPNRLFWGQDFHSSSLPGRNATWGEEAYVDAQFQKMTNKFISQGIPVMIGEFGPMKRTTANFPDLTGENVSLHLASRTYFNTSAPSMLPAKAAIPQKSRARPTSFAPAQLGSASAGNEFQLTWPEDHKGWRLQAQTNSLAAGLGTNWSNVAGPAQTNQMAMSLNVTDGAVFFRLVRL
jgi:hypothetical protein